jgi:2-polyprenyl-3-methyl-5-hydroxy-6-metoxy-1,4-benzoquinol methylase
VWSLWTLGKVFGVDDFRSWHEIQDMESTKSLESQRNVNRSESLLIRTYQFTAENLFYNSHIQNLVMCFPKDAKIQILDLGCGEGRVTRLLLEYFENASVVGVDSNVESIRIATASVQSERVTFSHGMFEDFSFRESFDAVVCSEVYEHVLNTKSLLDTIEFSLKPGGVLTFSTPSIWMDRQLRLKTLKQFVLHNRIWRIRNFSHKNWEDALPFHPGSSFKNLRYLFTKRNFQILRRSSSIPYIDYSSRSILYYLVVFLPIRYRERSLVFLLAKCWPGSSIEKAARLSDILNGMEIGMNTFPGLRFLESRMILLLKKCDK